MNVFALLNKLQTDRRISYIAVGGINTIVGYLCGLGLYYSLSPRFHIVVISILANISGISFSFLTYKLLVFKTKGNWLREYLRCYIVYGGSALVGTAGIWLLADFLHVAFWLAQGVIIVLIAVCSYVAHSRFSFAPSKNKPGSGDLE